MGTSSTTELDGAFEALKAALTSRPRLPLSTYRLQLNSQFGFTRAQALVPYLDALGVTDLYASPSFKAVTGSSHCYDVVDHRVLNPELGGAEGFDALAEELKAHDLGLLLDFVPNHMAIGQENPCWIDVLENGPFSREADFFDIDWEPIKEELRGKVLLPVLGDQYGAVLEGGELSLSFDPCAGQFEIAYADHRFPVAPRQYALILRHRLEELHGQAAPGDIALEDLLSIIAAIESLPEPPREQAHDRAAIEARHREKEVIKRRLATLCEGAPAIADFIEENVRRFNGMIGKPKSFDLLDELLRAQPYRLAYWRVAAEEINYRRFFDINSLAAIRIEEPHVFAEVHAQLFELLGQGKVTGLRIDHPDGLHAPEEYFDGLQHSFALHTARLNGQPIATLAPKLEGRCRKWIQEMSAQDRRPLYLVVEKILAHEETLPATWAVQGSTGYDFMNAVGGLFVDPQSERAITETAIRFSGLSMGYADLVFNMRRQTMSFAMVSELNMLARQLSRVSEQDRRTRDFTHNALRRALQELVAAFPIYRTYRRPDGLPACEADALAVDRAIAIAKRRNPNVEPSIFEFLRGVLVGEAEGPLPESTRHKRLAFALKLQQYTAPVMAKSVEDTAFYIYNRLVSLNEVGGEPDRFGVSVEAFHAQNLERVKGWPGSLLSTSTHDTKRSEDVRARVSVLSEIPTEWRRRLSTWARLNRSLRQRVGDALAPARNEELLLYQTLIGTWPFEDFDEHSLADYRQRVQAYMAKAIKEAKVNTSWAHPNEAWEAALDTFIARLLDPHRSARFWRDFVPFQKEIARVGTHNALAQLVLKLASPGVSDVYQGNELWDFSLVDPDNRRPVDFERRQKFLAELDSGLGGDLATLSKRLWESPEDGRIKLFVTTLGLRLRRRFPALFREGSYAPLTAEGDWAGHVVAFERGARKIRLIAAVPRLCCAQLSRFGTACGETAWGTTFLKIPDAPKGAIYRDVFTNRQLRVSGQGQDTGLWARDLFGELPIFLGVRA
ncbi:MAG: malto-oligosyltrehalose synthase [Myxococcales bacterium]|nr:malto-oligosyltrehalose synthase [Myxococcales bacterium]